MIFLGCKLLTLTHLKPNNHRVAKMHKLFLILAMALSLSCAVIAQDFTLTSENTAFEYITTNQMYSFHGQVTNLTANTIPFVCQLDTAGYPADWSFGWCMGEFCFPPFIFEYTDSIEAESYDTLAVYLTALNMDHFYGEVVFRVYPEGNPSAAQALTFGIYYGSGIETKNGKNPASFTLSPAYPNPFNPGTSFTYNVSTPGIVKAVVFNQLGQKAVELFNGYRQTGIYTIEWNGADANGVQLPSGTYYFNLNMSGETITAPVIKMK